MRKRKYFLENKKKQTSNGVEVLAFGPHPDDVEASCAGMLIKCARAGRRVGIVDLIRGELATNGTPEIRQRESKRAGEIIGVSMRENLRIPDKKLLSRSFSVAEESRIVDVVRKHRPQIVLVPYWQDRHPGHEVASRMISTALFSAKLSNVMSRYAPHVPRYVFYYPLWNEFQQTFILDISEEFETKEKALLAHSSQFTLKSGVHLTKNHENDFWGYWRARHRKWGYEIGVMYGEAYLSVTPFGVKDLESVLPNYS